jgi:hypothetical protein
MSNTEPTVIPPTEPVFEGNTITFEVVGNPNMVERIHVTENTGGAETFTYGYVDPTTNTFIHSHQMQKKKGSFL